MEINPEDSENLIRDLELMLQDLQDKGRKNQQFINEVIRDIARIKHEM